MNEEQYSNLINKLDTLENGLLSLNKDLIAQNILLSNKLLGPAPVAEDNSVVKELFYSDSNGRINIHGPGTYDNKDTIKSNGNWDSYSKSWNMNVQLETIKELFPNIIHKNM